jgi:hypothetical protein
MVYFGQLLDNYRSSGHFSMVPVLYKFLQIIGWATVWATFSNAHLVNLEPTIEYTPPPKKCGNENVL